MTKYNPQGKPNMSRVLCYGGKYSNGQFSKTTKEVTKGGTNLQISSSIRLIQR